MALTAAGQRQLIISTNVILFFCGGKDTTCGTTVAPIPFKLNVVFNCFFSQEKFCIWLLFCSTVSQFIYQVQLLLTLIRVLLSRGRDEIGRS